MLASAANLCTYSGKGHIFLRFFTNLFLVMFVLGLDVFHCSSAWPFSSRVCPSATQLLQHTRLLSMNASGLQPETSHAKTRLIVPFAGAVCACAPPHAIFRRGGGFAKNFPMCLVVDVSAEACNRYFIDPPLTTATTLVAAAIKVTRVMCIECHVTKFHLPRITSRPSGC